jgi:hypothetical protein
VEKVNAKKIDLTSMKEEGEEASGLSCSSGQSSHFYEERSRENVPPYGLAKQYHSAQIYAKIRRDVE